MSYCINPLCSLRPNNLVDAKTCRGCGDGLLIEGRYEILDILQSADPHPWQVFKVIDNQAQNFERFKILKTLNKYISPNPTDKEKEKLQTLERLFDREIQSLSVLRNAGIPRYEGMRFPLPSEGTRPKLDCFVMELIEGEDLGRWIASNKRLADITKARIWLKNITMILQYVHEQGYIHRDIKPTNIILKGNGKLALIDFGIVGEINSTISEKKSHTQVLDNHYAAPEQMANGSLYYIQSDFFAIGKTFVHLLTNRIPLPGRMELDEWKHDVEFIDTQSPDNDLSNNGIIPLIDWLMRADYRDRPQTSQQIIDVIDYISKRKSDSNFPNGIDTKKFICDVQTIVNNHPSVTTVVSPSSSSTPPVVQKERSKLLTGISIGILVIIVSFLPSILQKCVPDPEKDTKPNPNVPSNPSRQPPQETSEVLISFGDRDIYDYSVNIELQNKKKAAIESFNAKSDNHYLEAYNKFYAVWQLEQKNKTEKPTDPMLLIYMNNAKVRHWHSKTLAKKKINTIVLAAPIKDSRGKKMLYGVAHAQNRVVQKSSLSIDEEPSVYLEVGIVDDGNNPNQAIEVAKKLKDINITGVDGIQRQITTVIGHYTSESSCAALPSYAEAGLPIISPTSSMYKLGQKDTICNPSNKPVFFRTNSSSEIESKALIDLLKKRKIDNLKITAFYKKDTPEEKAGFSQDFFESFQRQYKNEFGKELKGFDLSTRDKSQDDLSLGIKDMQNSNVIVLFPNGNTNDGSDAFKNAETVIDKANEINKENSGQIKLILGSNPLLSQDIIATKFAGWKGKFGIAVDWHKQCSSQINGAFLFEQKDLWGENDVDRIIAQSYEAVQVISTILSKPEISKGSSFLSKLAAVESFKIKSEVFKDKNISFKENGDRKYIESRIVVTPEIVSSKLRFTPIDPTQCR